MRYVACILIVMVLISSCRSRNASLLPFDSTKVIMWDLMKMDEMFARMSMKDSTLRNTKKNIVLYEEVFALHHITKQQFETTYRYYTGHPVEFKRLLDSIEALSLRDKNRANPNPVR